MAQFDFLTPAIILAFAGLSATIFFSSLKERRDRKDREERQEEKRLKEKKEQEEKMEAQRQAFAQEVKDTVSKQANDLKERLDDKLEVIRVSTSGLESNLEEFKTVNRDELLSIKREIQKLKDEADTLGKQVQTNEIDKKEAENRMNNLQSQIQNLEQKLNNLEVRISNHEGISSTRK